MPTVKPDAPAIWPLKPQGFRWGDLLKQHFDRRRALREEQGVS
jgi:hypothetical protein